jgi:phage recombination protein Bet
MTKPQQNTQALVQTAAGPLAITKWGMTGEQLDLLKRTIARGVTDDEFALFMTVASRMGLDPFAKQIHAVKRWDNDLGREVMAIQIGIDGYRLGASRTGEDDGQEGPFWCGQDGIWRDVWLDEGAPLAAKVVVHRKGRARPYVGVALWASYVQTKKDGSPNAMWRRHGPGQLAKCAEALAIRKAFPAELGGTHTDDEIGEGAVDAEFTEIRSIASAPPAAAAQSQASPPVAKPAPQPMSEDDEIELMTSLGKTDTIAALKEVGRKIPYSTMDEPTRQRWAKAYEDQFALIRAAAAAAEATP